MKMTRIVALLSLFVGIVRAALPTIDTQPANSTNCPGTAATFTVAASSDSSTNYQWYFNETNLLVDATNTSYTIPSVLAGDAGGYSVVVTNIDGAVTSIVAQLVVNDPTTATGPANATVCPGASMSFVVTPSGTGPFSYVWRKDGGAPLGSTSNQLDLASILAGDAGIYSVEVTGACNSVTNSATLGVNTLLSATGPDNTNLCAGGSVSLVTTPSGTGPLSYVWRKDGGPALGSTSNQLDLVALIAGDAGVYSVEITGPCNSVTNSATVGVTAVPVVSVNSAIICPGGAAILTATHNAASPTFLWSPGGQTTESVTNSPGSTTVYTVTVTDGVTGCSAQANGTITVNTLTSASGPGNQTNCPGGNLVFTTTASGTGPFSYVWRKDGGSPLAETGNTLTLTGVTAADNGTYSVEVTGTCNSVTNSALGVVIPAPSITVQPQNQATPMGNGAVFSVTASTINSVLAPLSYQWRTNGVDVTGVTASSFAISNLTLAANGMLVSVAVTTCGGTTLSANAVLSVTPISAVSFDFNTPGQWTNAPFNIIDSDWMDSSINSGGFNNPLLTTLPFEMPTGGVGAATGGGSLDMAFNNGTDRAMTFVPLTYDFSLPGKTLTASIMFKNKAIVTAGRRSLQMAFVTTTNFNNAWQQVNANNGQGFMSAILQSSVVGLPGQFQLRAQNKLIAGTATSEQIPVNSPTNTLPTNSWYRFVATFNNVKAAGTASSNYTVQSYVQDMGVDGLTPGATLLAMAPLTITNVDMVNFRNLFFCIRGFEDGGQDFWDNVFVTTATGPIAFTVPMENQSVAQGRTVSWSAMVDGDGPYTYQWYKNGVAIPGAGNWKYRTPQLTIADNGAQYAVVVTSTNNAITNTATVTVTADPLDVLSVGSVDGGVIGLRFDQPVDKTSAETAANYTIATAGGSAPAVAAQLRLYNNLQRMRTNATEVLITPASPISGSFTVTVASVTSISGDAIGVNNSAAGTVAGLTGFDVDPLDQIPAPLQNGGQPIGTAPGANYSFAPGHFEVSAGGHDLFGNFDGFRFVYKKVTGDFDWKVRVPYIDLYRTAQKAGFDARVTLDSTSPHVGAFVNPRLPARNFTEGTYRTNFATLTSSWGNGRANAAGYPDVWLRFRRVGNTFLRYASTNGVDWLSDGQVSPEIGFPETLYVGIAANANTGANVVQQPVTSQYEAFGPFAGYPGAVIAITSQPANQTINAGVAATLSVTNTVGGGGIPAGGEVVYVWQRTNSAAGGWTNMVTAGATNNNISTGPLYRVDNGAQYRVIIKAPGAADVTSAVATVTVNDTAAPTVASVVVPPGQPGTLVLTFNEFLSDTALNTANYSVTNGAGASFTVSGASFLNGDRRTVILTVNGAGGDLGVTINGVQDLNANSIAANTRRTYFASPAPTAPIIIERFGGLATAGNLSDLTNNAKFLAQMPDFIVYSNHFGFLGGTPAIQTGPDNYGARFRTYFVPPTNGAYKFWLRGDDFLTLMMNTNTVNSTDPAGKRQLINMTANNPNHVVANSFTSAVLNAGQAYYMELLFKEGGGGDGAGVAIRSGGDNNVPPNTEMANGMFLYPTAIAPPVVSVVEIYTNLFTTVAADNALPDLSNSLASIKVSAGAADVIGYGKAFGVASNLVNTSFEHYYGRVYSYYVAPSNGNYKFYMRSDDASQLLINTNGTDAAGASVVGQLTAFTGNYTLVAQNISLTNGERYYIESRWKEGTGGDGAWVVARSQGDAGVPPNTELIPLAQLQFPTNIFTDAAVPTAVISPVNPVIKDGQSITFTGAGRGNAYLWLKNGQQLFVNNEFNSVLPSPQTYRSQPFTMADNGAVIALLMTNNFGTAIATSTITVLADTAGPQILTAVGSQYGDSVVVTFDEQVTPETAQQLANYSIAGLTIYGVDYDDVSKNRVTLRTSRHTAGAAYALVVNGVRDFSSVGNAAVGATKNFTAWGFGGVGGVLVEYWTNMQGASLDIMFTDPRYVNGMPDGYYYTNTFAVGPYAAESGRNFWGARVSGLFMPPSNGLYRFYVRGDDGTRIFMNTNGPDPAGRVLIARNDGANSGTYANGVGLGYVGASMSPPLSLTNGTPYYLEAMFKEGTGGDYFQVVMTAVDGSGNDIGGTPAPAAGLSVSGGYFSAPGNPDLIQFVVNSTPPAEIFVTELDPVALTLNATAIPASLTPFVSYQWSRSNALSGVFTNMPGKTFPTLSFFAPLSDDGAAYRLIATLPGTTLTYETLVHVSQTFDPPVLLSVGSLDGNTIGARFNKPVDLGTAQEEGNWSINLGAITVTDATVRTNVDPRTVVLTLQFPVTGDFTVDALSIGDQSANLNIGDTYGIVGSVQGLTGLDLGGPLAAGSSFTSTNGEISVVAGGADIWGTADQGHFTLGQRSGDFDIWTRVDSLLRTSADTITKAGVVVRDGTNAEAKTLTVLMNPPAALGGRDLVEAGSRTNVVPGVTAPTGVWPSSTNVTPARIPNAWVRLKRTGWIWRAMYSSNGVDWVGFATNFVDFPRTVYVGLGTTAHNNTAPPTVAEYRDIHIPNPPGISVQPSPASQSVAFHGSVSYSVMATNSPNGGTLAYTWRRDGVVVGTGDTLNIPDARGVDAGSYQVEVTGDGGSVLSDVVTLSVNNGLPTIGSDSISATQNVAYTFPVANLLGNDSDPEGSNLVFRTISGVMPVTVGTNFNQGTLAGATILGTTYASTNGYLVFHNAAINGAGSLILDDLTPGKRVSGFRASFKLRMSEGTLEPADGFSFNFAPDLPISATTPAAAENGGGTGFSFCVDSYRFVPYPTGGTANTSGMKLRFGGVDIGGVATPTWNRPDFVPVTIEVVNSAVTVTVDGTNVFGTVILPSVTSTGRFGIYARSGGQYHAAMLDDLSITVYTSDTAGGGSLAYSGGNVTYSNAACAGSDTFYYVVGDGEVGGDVTAPVAVSLTEANPQPPLIVTCATNRTYTLYTNSQIALPNLTGEIVATDTCGTPVVTQSPLPGTLLSAGPNVVTFTATDATGSNTTCQITITVVVVQPQIIAGSLSFGGTTFSGSFQTENGVTYAVEYKDDLNAPTWTLLTTIVGDGTVKPFTDPGPLPAARFYQIRPLP